MTSNSMIVLLLVMLSLVCCKCTVSDQANHEDKDVIQSARLNRFLLQDDADIDSVEDDEEVEVTEAPDVDSESAEDEDLDEVTDAPDGDIESVDSDLDDDDAASVDTDDDGTELEDTNASIDDDDVTDEPDTDLDDEDEATDAPDTDDDLDDADTTDTNDASLDDESDDDSVVDVSLDDDDATLQDTDASVDTDGEDAGTDTLDVNTQTAAVAARSNSQCASLSSVQCSGSSGCLYDAVGHSCKAQAVEEQEAATESALGSALLAICIVLVLSLIAVAAGLVYYRRRALAKTQGTRMGKSISLQLSHVEQEDDDGLDDGTPTTHHDNEHLIDTNDTSKIQV